MPHDVVSMIMDKAFADNELKTRKALVMIGASCKSLKRMTEDVWVYLWNKYKIDNPAYPRNAAILKLSISNRLSLLCDKGCQLCKKPRIRKVYSEFAVRCCEECLHANTLSNWRLVNDYMIDKNILQKLPNIKQTMYSRGYGTYTLLFYWKDDVRAVIGKDCEQYRLEQLEAYKKEKTVELEKTLVDYPFDVDFVHQHTHYVKQMNEDPRLVNIKTILHDATRKYRIEYYQKQLLSYPGFDNIEKPIIHQSGFYQKFINKADRRVRPLTEKDYNIIKAEVFAIVNANRLKQEQEAQEKAFLETVQNMRSDLQAQLDLLKQKICNDDKLSWFGKYESIFYENLGKFNFVCPYCMPHTRKFSKDSFKQHFLAKHSG